MTAQLIHLAERRRTAAPARETQDQVDELRAELAVRRAESLVAARRIHSLAHRGLYASQEEARVIAAVAPEPEPIRIVA